MRKIVIVAFFLVLGSGCASKRVLEAPIRPVEANDLWRDQAARRALLSQFSGKLKLGYEGKKQSVSGKGRIVGKAPNAFRVELRDPIGRLHYVLILKGNTLWAHYPRNRQAIKEEAGGKIYFKRLLGMGMPFSEIAALFAGVIPAKWDKSKPVSWEWDSSQGAFKGVWEQGKERLTLWVDSGNVGISAFKWDSESGPIEGEYSDFDGCCDSNVDRKSFFLAYNVKMKMPSESTSIEVNWDSLNKAQDLPGSAFEFALPAGDKSVEIK